MQPETISLLLLVTSLIQLSAVCLSRRHPDEEWALVVMSLCSLLAPLIPAGASR
jgi:hypothetical protein